MRSREEIRAYRTDIGHTDDTVLVDAMDALLSGDERHRQYVEEGMDQIDRDVAKYESPAISSEKG